MGLVTTEIKREQDLFRVLDEAMRTSSVAAQVKMKTVDLNQHCEAKHMRYIAWDRFRSPGCERIKVSG